MNYGRPKILITGATGEVGSYLVNSLLQKGIRFRISVRNPKKVEHLDESIERGIGDLDRIDTIEPAMEGIERIFLLTSNTQQDKNILQAAKKSGLKHNKEFYEIHLSGGTVIVTRGWWYEGDMVMFKQHGGSMGVEKNRVEEIVARN